MEDFDEVVNKLHIWHVIDRCDMPLGVEDGRVPDPLMRASSFYNYYCGPFNARLNRRRYGRHGGAWCAKRRDRRQWLQIDFGALTKVCRVATQGRQNAAQWVTSYYITYSRNGYKFTPYREGRRTKVTFFTCKRYNKTKQQKFDRKNAYNCKV